MSAGGRFLDLIPSGDLAFIDAATDTSRSFGDLLELGRDVAAEVGSRRRALFLLCRNDAFTVVAYAGAVIAGHAVALLDARSPTDMTAEILDAYRPAVVAGPPGTAARLAEAGLHIGTASPVAGGEVVRMDDDEPESVHPDLAVMLSTSGTTGSRKFVRLSRRNVEANAASIAECLDLGPGDRPITSLPIHYSFGLSVLDSHWLVGAPVVLTDESVAQAPFWTVFRDHCCTSLAGVPFSYQVLERVGFRTMDLPTLRTLQQAGGALDRRLAAIYGEHMAARGGRFFVMYGQTEATARIAYVPPDRLAEKLGSAGIAIPGGRIRIESVAVDEEDGREGRREDGVSVAARESDGSDSRAVGEVIYEGPNVMLGYATGREDLALGDELDGVLHTGDLGYLDADGFLFLVGRSKRIAKVFGQRVNLDEVEVALREHGPAAVVGGPDSIRGFCAFGTDESVADLGMALARRLKLHHSGVRLQRVNEVPTTASGKIDYRQVEDWVGDKAAEGRRPRPTPT